MAAALIGAFLSGCTTFSQHHPQFQRYRQPMGVMLMLPPEIAIFEQLSDGSRLYREEFSQRAQRGVQASIIEQLGARRFAVKTVDPDTMKRPAYADVVSLFRSVNHSIQLHTLGPQPYPGKRKAFEYDLGPVDGILEENGADGLVLSLGHQTGFEPAAQNWLSIAVVEPQGRIIWYGMSADGHKYDFQRRDGLASLVADTLVPFWKGIP